MTVRRCSNLRGRWVDNKVEKERRMHRMVYRHTMEECRSYARGAPDAIGMMVIRMECG